MDVIVNGDVEREMYTLHCVFLLFCALCSEIRLKCHSMYYMWHIRYSIPLSLYVQCVFSYLQLHGCAIMVFIVKCKHKKPTTTTPAAAKTNRRNAEKTSYWMSNMMFHFNNVTLRTAIHMDQNWRTNFNALAVLMRYRHIVDNFFLLGYNLNGENKWWHFERSNGGRKVYWMDVGESKYHGGGWTS